jgi:23S rRNA (cytidine1920-2'-O)/16S rRNA (cytidine1409-2'-O)-methyltransferase
MAKKRLDIIITNRELVPTRSQAQALIMAGQVSANGRILDKPGQLFDESIDLHLKNQPRYVSRAGEKLASIVEPLGLDFEGKIVLDVGSSTGGFTDYALQNGAVKSYCIDVGTGQLAYKLRQDPRVVVMEKTDIRDVDPPKGSESSGSLQPITDYSGVTDNKKRQKLPELADIAVIDVSFISLTKIMESVAALVKPGHPIVAMVKPQFEAGKDLADKYHGVIPMGRERDEILAELREYFEQLFAIDAEADSGLSGAEGNVERFFLLRTKSD